MSNLLSRAETYAKLKGTKVMAYRELDPQTIVVVLESGPKETFTQKELEQVIADLKPTLATPEDAPTPKTKRKPSGDQK